MNDLNKLVRYRRLQLTETIREGDLQFCHPPVGTLTDQKLERMDMKAGVGHIGKTTEDVYPDDRKRNRFYRLKKQYEIKPNINSTIDCRTS